MLSAGGNGDIIANLQGLSVVPLPISYECDPYDFLKAQEFQLRHGIPDLEKTTDSDLLNIQTELPGYKGRVCFRIASYVNEGLAELGRTLPRPRLFTTISALIDKHIHASYHIFANNYVTRDLLYSAEEFANHYTAENKKRFASYIDTQLECITTPDEDVDFPCEKLLLMHTDPLTNHLVTIK